MSGVLYDAVAFGMRYWFLLLIALMLFTLIGISVSEYRQRKSVMGIVGQYIGYIEVTGGDEESIGMRIGLTAENLIGSGKRADIVIDDPLVAKIHAQITYRDGRLYMKPLGGNRAKINGRLATREHEIVTEDILTFGSISCVVYLREADEDDDT
jgi:hypothetical protein